MARVRTVFDALLSIISHWTMEFDARPQVIEKINSELKLDPIVIRHGCVRMAEKLREKVAVEKEIVDAMQVATHMKAPST